jgi:hypothetical protein
MHEINTPSSEPYRTNNIIFQHPAALVNNLIYRVSFEGATSCHAHGLLLCAMLSFFYKRYFSDMFQPHTVLGIYIYVIAALYCLF